MKKAFNIQNIVLCVNIILILTIFVLNYFYQSNGFDFTLKCICSTGFALLGLINLSYAVITRKSNISFYALMASGLVLAMLGDVIIKYSFIFGAAIFALGHICFVVAYCFLNRMRLLDYLLSGALFLGSSAFLLFCPMLTFDVPIFRLVCIVYALIISLMLGKAIGNAIHIKTTRAILIAVASLLFFFSDLMLVLDWFIGRWSWTNEACMGSYYPALCFLAFSMLVPLKETSKTSGGAE